MQGAFLYLLTTVLMFTGWYFSSTGREEGRVPYVNWGKFGLLMRVSCYFSVLGCGVYFATRSVNLNDETLA